MEKQKINRNMFTDQDNAMLRWLLKNKKGDVKAAAKAFFDSKLNQKEGREKHSESTIRKHIRYFLNKPIPIKKSDTSYLNGLLDKFENKYTAMSSYTTYNPDQLRHYFTKNKDNLATVVHQETLYEKENPNQPNGGDPGQASTGNPTQPNDGDPNQASTGNPTQPNDGDPNQASSGNPAQPNDGDPGHASTGSNFDLFNTFGDGGFFDDDNNVFI